MRDTELAGILCARICHDLGSPVGATVNGVELVRELGAAEASDEVEMLERSARRTMALLNFHRLAFGVVRDPQATLPRADLRARAEEVLGGGRVELGWSAGDGPPLSMAAGRLAALMLLAGRAMLGLSGALRVMLPASGDLPLAVMAEGPNAAVSDERRRWLGGAVDPAPEPSEVEFALLPAAAAAVGARIELVEGSGQIALRALAA